MNSPYLVKFLYIFYFTKACLQYEIFKVKAVNFSLQILISILFINFDIFIFI